MNIICLYWIGEFRGRNFTVDDVKYLYDLVENNIDRPFDFYCLTNTLEHLPNHITKILLRHNWPGWWSKIELHRPDLPKGRTLYMDLDTYIVGSLEPLFTHTGDLVMFNTKSKEQGNGLISRYQAATMLFDSGCEVMNKVWNKFVDQPSRWMNNYRSDQDVMGDWIPNQPTFPNRWMMKLSKCNVLKTVPQECIIITGQPTSFDFRGAREIEWERA